jgi:hypothetical protein
MKTIFTLENNQRVLKAAACYGLLFGFIVSFFPHILLKAFNAELSFGIEFWQFFGIIIGVAGIGYGMSSSDPGRNWPIVFIGFLGNLLGSLIFIKSLLFGTLPLAFASFLFVSTFIWVIPFFYILMAAYEENTFEFGPSKKFDDLVNLVRTSKNATLSELSNDKKVMLIFVRHFGCTFCRETVFEMAKIDKVIKDKKYEPVFVHMSDQSFGDEFFSRYYDHPIHHISDPGRMLYKSLNLCRGTFSQVFGPMTWLRSITAGIFKGHGVGEFEGDILQLGGVFILDKGQVIFEQKANCASHVIHFNSLPEV